MPFCWFCHEAAHIQFLTNSEERNKYIQDPIVVFFFLLFFLEFVLRTNNA